jgi:hypothetical protein
MSAAGGVTPKAIQQIEGGLIVALTLTGTIVLAPSWWWIPLAAFLLFDLSQLGYLRSPTIGAAWYNAIHTYAWPAALAITAMVTHTVSPAVSLWSAVIAFAWAFHIGVDRMLGFGLKLPDAFTHTHMGWLGKDRTKNYE